jgi:acyl-CoA thioester hydrolase
MLTYSYKFYPRFADTDAYDVFHHASYYYWFEEARFSFSKEVLKFDETIVSGKDIKFPVIESACRYKRSISYVGKELEISLTFSITKSNKVVFDYKVLDDNVLCATGKTVHVMLCDGKLQFEFPDWFLEGVDVG